MASKYRSKYNIRSIVPGRDYKGVWTHEVDGELVLEAYPLDFIGVADRQVFSDDKWVDDGPDIVPVMLFDSFFDVVDENENFHGIVPVGASWEDCFELVPPDRQRRLHRSDDRDGAGITTTDNEGDVQ
jgi:hypothetical protein